MSILNRGAGSTLVRTGVVVALAMTTIGALATSSEAAAQAVTLSAVSGPKAGGNTITVTLPANASPKFTSGSIGVQFQNAGGAGAGTAAAATAYKCTGDPTAAALVADAATGPFTAPAANVRFLSSTKISVKVPDMSGNATATYWALCVYPTAPSAGVISGSQLALAKAIYIEAAAPLVDDGTDHSGSGGPNFSGNPVAVTPANGPALGGQTVTISGANFPAVISATAPLTATLGGLPLTNITAVNSTTFTAVTPPHAASATAVSVAVTTNGGTATFNSAYTYVNGITVSPTTVVGASAVDIDVQGVGFNSLTFTTTDGTAPEDAHGHVYLVQGTYSPQMDLAVAATYKKPVPESTECINVAVISDTELICTVDTASKITYAANSGTPAATAAGAATPTYGAGTLPDGTYTVTVVNSGAPYNDASAVTTNLTYKSVLSSGATFTVAAF